MLEWLKRHAWKACIPQKGISGSNPDLSASINTSITYIYNWLEVVSQKIFIQDLIY